MFSPEGTAFNFTQSEIVPLEEILVMLEELTNDA